MTFIHSSILHSPTLGWLGVKAAALSAQVPEPQAGWPADLLVTSLSQGTLTLSSRQQDPLLASPAQPVDSTGREAQGMRF